MRAARAAVLVIGLALAPKIALADDAGVPGVTVRWERPDAGTLERGAFGVEAWVVLAMGASIVLASAIALITAARRARGAQR